MFSGSRITNALKEDIDRMVNPEKWIKIDRKRKLDKLYKKSFFFRTFFFRTFFFKNIKRFLFHFLEG